MKRSILICIMSLIISMISAASVDTIIWTGKGINNNWDTYNNWINKKTGYRLTNRDTYTRNLTAIIRVNSKNIYPNTSNIQKIRINKNLYVKKIIIEYGASLMITPLFGKYELVDVNLLIADRSDRFYLKINNITNSLEKQN